MCIRDRFGYWDKIQTSPGQYQKIPAKGSSTNIQVAMCNDGSSNDDSSNYFVYQLPKPKSCDQRYCGED